MRIAPARDEIAAILGKHPDGTLLHTRFLADLTTPVSAMLKLRRHIGDGSDGGGAYSCLLESVEGGERLGRFSIIALDPDLLWRAEDGKARSFDAATGKALGKPDDDVFASLRRLIAESRLDIPEGLPPMAAGLFGYFGYEMVHHIEKLPLSNPDPLGAPDAILMRPQIVVIFDRLRDEMTICTPCRRRENESPEDAWDAAAARLEKTLAALHAPDTPDDGGDDDAITAPLPEPQSNIPRDDFLGMVQRAVHYIKSGDIFQVVLSQRFTIPFTLPPLDLYRALRRLNPSPFLICFDFGEMALVGSSPEILVRLRDGTVTLRPIAGTRPRGKTAAEDNALADELLADVKERAEHLMLLDLGRNDTGRISRPGSVRVEESFGVERYSHVMHIVSEVTGKIRTGLDTVDALQAGFPAGTVTGAPKIRAMEIIDELEPIRRGPYAGAAGYISADGDMDTCIILRTAILKDGKMHAQAGAGIVYDSVPESEFAETENKAMVLIRAAEEAVNLKRRGRN